MTKATGMMNRYRVDPDSLDLDPKVYEIMEAARKNDDTVQQTFNALVAEGFAPEACRWVIKLFNAISAGTAGSVH